MHVYLNGRVIPEREARISTGDHGFLYGIGVFETFRTFRARPFLLDHHIERLLRGCSALRIELPDTFLTHNGRFTEILGRLLDANGWPDAIFRYTISAGESSPGLPRAPYSRPTELLVPRPLPRDRRGPISLHLLKTRRNSPEFHPRPKSLSYINSLMGHLEMRERQSQPGDEGLLLTPEGNLSEGITSNVFLVRDDSIETPSPRHNLLPGITRQAIIDLAGRANIAVRERDLTPSDLAGADALFITSSVRGPVPATRVYDIDGRPIWRAPAGPNTVFGTLETAYRQMLP